MKSCWYRLEASCRHGRMYSLPSISCVLSMAPCVYSEKWQWVRNDGGKCFLFTKIANADSYSSCYVQTMKLQINKSPWKLTFWRLICKSQACSKHKPGRFRFYISRVHKIQNCQSNWWFDVQGTVYLCQLTCRCTCRIAL